MHSARINLLPFECQRARRREYFVRVAIVSIVLATVLIGIAALLLVPTYLFLSGEIAAKKTRLADTESSLHSLNEDELAARLSALSADAAVLTKLLAAPSVSGMMRTILAVAHPGITLSSFSYAPMNTKGSAPGSFTISGIAATRDALRSYQLALEGLPFARSADLPVSAYAQDTAITFTVTLSLASSATMP